MYHTAQMSTGSRQNAFGYDGGASGQTIYHYVGGNPAARVDPFGFFTLQVGGTISVGFMGGSGTVSVGFAADSGGNVAGFGTVGVGAGEGAGASLGFSGAVSNGKTVSDLSGLFAQGGITGGVGAGGSVDVFAGPSDNGLVTGAGATVGIGAGVGAFAGPTNTWIWPIWSPPKAPKCR